MATNSVWLAILEVKKITEMNTNRGNNIETIKGTNPT
jgi:hypothetical protein